MKTIALCRNTLALTLFSFIFLLTSGCDPYRQDSYEEQLVIYGMLTAGEPFSPIRLTRTVPFSEAYSEEAAALRNMHVRVIEMDEDGEFIRTIQYQESERDPGVYFPRSRSSIVQGRFRYRAEVRQVEAAELLLSAQTIVPGSFELVETNGSTFIYQGPEQYEATYTTSFYPGRQNYFIISTRALNPELGMTPFYDSIAEEPDEFITVSSPIINEQNYELNPDGTITLRLPWISVSHFGISAISVFAIDTNWYDYQRSLGVQLGGSTVSPGQIENLLWNVEGGIGVFGSRAGVRSEVTILSPPIP
ncbi:MAG: DUF4249 domain-containing protein [Balneolales bacterium]|nr:DUF4249 domain-containing protein [Balneolales bacterium]